MAFFGKLFEKKVCDLCGGEIGLLGNKKLPEKCPACGRRLDLMPHELPPEEDETDAE